MLPQEGRSGKKYDWSTPALWGEQPSPPKPPSRRVFDPTCISKCETEGRVGKLTFLRTC